MTFEIYSDNMVETSFFETCSTSYANSMALWIIL